MSQATGRRWIGVSGVCTSVLVFGLCASLIRAQDAPKADAGAWPQFVGAESCKLCHSRKSIGSQYKIWTGEKHSKAFENLATPQAKEVGAKLGVTDPQKDPKCLKCHVTGYGEPKERFSASYKPEEGITCEACHGAASLYKDEENHTKAAAKSDKFGLLHPDEKTCIKCHNEESPNYKPFEYKKFFDDIKHPLPKEGK